MRILSLLLFFSIIPCLTMAQKKELSQARTYIKGKNNYDKAEQLMTGLLKDSANQRNERIYAVWLEAVRGQFDQANERLYLKQNPDTATFFRLTKRMFAVAEALDSVDGLPDKKGNISYDYRQKNAATLNAYRINLYNGGTYFLSKGNWQEAYNFMDAYIDCARQPLFTGYDYNASDTRMPEAAYWATFSGYMLHDATLTLAHHQQALADSAHQDFALQFTAEAYRWQGDEAAYTATLQTGFQRYPLFPYFFPRLTDVYTSRGEYDRALALADSALQACDTCQLFLYAKSAALLRLDRNEESIRYSRRLIELNDSLPEPYYNASMAYVNMAAALEPLRDKVLMTDYYQKARTYMEYYRMLMPAEQQKWAPVLYRIYLNLNLGKQFDEMDRLLNNMKK